MSGFNAFRLYIRIESVHVAIEILGLSALSFRAVARVASCCVGQAPCGTPP